MFSSSEPIQRLASSKTAFKQKCAEKAKHFVYLQIHSRKKLSINMFRIISPLKISEPFKYISTMIMPMNVLQNIFLRIYTQLVYTFLRLKKFWSKCHYCLWPKPYKNISSHNKTFNFGTNLINVYKYVVELFYMQSLSRY